MRCLCWPAQHTTPYIEGFLLPSCMCACM
jgi:hypothetical protein